MMFWAKPKLTKDNKDMINKNLMVFMMLRFDY